MDFSTLQKNLEQVIETIDIIVLESAMDNQTTIADIQADQMSVGLLSDGEPIRPELRSDEYANLKIAEGGRAPLYTPDLHNEGSFYRGIYAKIVDKAIETNSTDGKTDDLISKYGPLIFGLTEAFSGKLAEFILPDLQKKLKDGLINS